MNVKELKLYFDQLKEAIEEYDVQFEDTWNMNETEFRLDCEKFCIIITLDIKKSFKITDSDNREYITSIKIISVDDEIISSMLIVKKNFILHRFAVNDLEELIILVFNDFDYSNDDLTLNWLYHFINNVVRKRRDKYILLIVNDFDSHLTFEFFELIIDNDIILFKLSAHFTHITQSLDVEVFQIFKHHHDEVINKTMRRKTLKFDKENFLQVFKSFRSLAFKHETIKSAWRKIDIHSFNSSVVLNFLRQRQASLKAKTITSSRSLTSRTLERTFYDLETIKASAKALRQDLIRDEVIVDHLLRFVKDFEMLIEAFELHTRDLNDCLKISESRKHRERYSQTQATSSDVITTKNCRKLHSARLKKIKKIAERKTTKLVKKAEKENTKFAKVDARIVADKAEKLAKLVDDMRVRVINDEIVHTVAEHEYEKRLKQEAQEEIDVEKKKEKKKKEKKKLNYFYLQMTRSSNMKYKSSYRPGAQLERFQYTNSHRRAWNTVFEATMMDEWGDIAPLRKLRCRPFEMSEKVSKTTY